VSSIPVNLCATVGIEDVLYSEFVEMQALGEFVYDTRVESIDKDPSARRPVLLWVLFHEWSHWLATQIMLFYTLARKIDHCDVALVLVIWGVVGLFQSRDINAWLSGGLSDLRILTPDRCWLEETRAQCRIGSVWWLLEVTFPSIARKDGQARAESTVRCTSDSRKISC